MLPFSHLRRQWLVMLGLALLSPAVFAQYEEPRGDETIKSYFLLRWNLESEPLDLKNYFDALQFREDFKDFAGQFAQPQADWSADENSLLKWAIADGLNGDLDPSMKKFHQLIVRPPVRQNAAILSAIYALMGRIMELKADHERALSYRKQALEMAISAKSPELIARSYLFLGKIKSLCGWHESAETDLLKQALPAFTRLKKPADIANCYREIAAHYQRQQLYTQSNWFYLQSLGTARKAGYAPGVIAALLETGQYKFDTGALEEALRDWQEAEKIAIKSHQLSQLLQLKYDLNWVNLKLGRLEVAAKYASEFEQLRDIILNPV